MLDSLHAFANFILLIQPALVPLARIKAGSHTRVRRNHVFIQDPMRLCSLTAQIESAASIRELVQLLQQHATSFAPIHARSFCTSLGKLADAEGSSRTEAGDRADVLLQGIASVLTKSDVKSMENLTQRISKAGIHKQPFWERVLVLVVDEMLVRVQHLSPRELGNVTHSLAELGTAAEELIVAIARQAKSRLHEFSINESIHMALAFAKADMPVLKLLSSIEREVPAHLSDFKPCELVNIIQAFANANVSAPRLCAAVQYELQKRRHEFCPKELTQINSALQMVQALVDTRRNTVSSVSRRIRGRGMEPAGETLNLLLSPLLEAQENTQKRQENKAKAETLKKKMKMRGGIEASDLEDEGALWGYTALMFRKRALLMFQRLTRAAESSGIPLKAAVAADASIVVSVGGGPGNDAFGAALFVVLVACVGQAQVGLGRDKGCLLQVPTGHRFVVADFAPKWEPICDRLSEVSGVNFEFVICDVREGLDDPSNKEIAALAGKARLFLFSYVLHESGGWERFLRNLIFQASVGTVFYFNDPKRLETSKVEQKLRESSLTECLRTTWIEDSLLIVKVQALNKTILDDESVAPLHTRGLCVD